MRHLEFRITAPFAGKKIEWFLRGDQGISHRVVIQLKKLPEGILLNGPATPAPSIDWPRGPAGDQPAGGTPPHVCEPAGGGNCL